MAVVSWRAPFTACGTMRIACGSHTARHYCASRPEGVKGNVCLLRVSAAHRQHHAGSRIRRPWLPVSQRGYPPPTSRRSCQSGETSRTGPRPDRFARLPIRRLARASVPMGCHALVVTGWRDLAFRTEWTIPYRKSWPWQARPGQGKASTGWTQPGQGTASTYPPQPKQQILPCRAYRIDQR